MSFAERFRFFDKRKPASRADVVLGEDWVSPDGFLDQELRAGRERRGLLSLNRSPLARKIIVFNLLAMVVLVAGVLYLNPFRDSLAIQRETGLVSEAQLIAAVFEVQVPRSGPVNLATADGIDAPGTIAGIEIPPGVEVFVFDHAGAPVTSTLGQARPVPETVSGIKNDRRPTIITDFLNAVWETISLPLAFRDSIEDAAPIRELTQELVPDALGGETRITTALDASGETVFAVATPIRRGDSVIGVVALASAASEIDRLVRVEREQILEMFFVAVVVSIGLSLLLASTIANPLSDLAAAAELGRDKNARRLNPGRVRIPDLTARPDEIGRLSGAMRGMVAALYDRIEGNEQFAADVAHEIKNPLASLRSAVGTLRLAKRDDQREKLLDVIDHDVRRLDRLVSDISNASRLDSELVKEEEEVFDLIKTLRGITQYFSDEAKAKGIDFIGDLPTEAVMTTGLEARLAQVFVNLISNAISFCEKDDAVRVWARKRENRILVVVEDTGPGIPDQALQKIFKRFYSERPAGQFGNHSGLGLAISKQIIEAHGGVIWAENIRTADADMTTPPLGARFVVGLPL